MVKPIRWGVLSTANIGRRFVHAVGNSATSCVQAVASRDWTRASEWAQELGIPRAFGSYDELIHSKEIDALYISLPNSLHAEWTIKALEAGVPVLCEKPFTVNADQAREVAAVARRTGVLAVEAFMYRFHPVYDRILGLLEEGAIGEVISLSSAFAFRLSDRANIRASAELAGGALMDVGCYCVNVSRRMAGCEPVRVQAFERRTTVDDTLMGALVFPNGILAQFECSIENNYHTRLEITGTQGAIILDSPWIPGETETHFVLRREKHEEIITTPGADPYQLEAEDFVAACRRERSPRWGLDDVIANMTVIDALYASTRNNAAVMV